MKNKSPLKCPTKFCRNDRGNKRPTCPKCSLRAWRKANPIADILNNVRQRAKRKKLDYDLDLEWFKAFLLDQNYDRNEHHIDRISAAKGYVKGNLQILPISENIAKGNRERGAQLQIL